MATVDERYARLLDRLEELVADAEDDVWLCVGPEQLGSDRHHVIPAAFLRRLVERERSEVIA